MSTAWFRFAYACEFLLAVPAVFTLWSQVGGQGHLDLMSWYWKLGLGCGGSIAVVGLTAALVGQDRFVTRPAAFWAMAIIVMACAMAAVTFYYHVHEVIDEPDEEGTTASSGYRSGLLT
jgi:hypothetical protein